MACAYAVLYRANKCIPHISSTIPMYFTILGFSVLTSVHLSYGEALF